PVGDMRIATGVSGWVISLPTGTNRVISTINGVSGQDCTLRAQVIGNVIFPPNDCGAQGIHELFLLGQLVFEDPLQAGTMFLEQRDQLEREFLGARNCANNLPSLIGFGAVL